MAGLAEKSGLEIVPAPERADVIVVNTCGFIESARRESIDVLLEMARLTADGTRQLVAAGCMAQRYALELAEEMPEIDCLIGTSELLELPAMIGKGERLAVKGAGHFLPGGDTPRFVEPGTVSTYIKIGDGCARQCAFCAIPSIRGKARSRPMAEIVKEAKRLVSLGVKELNLVAQDTGAYGRDRGDRSDLPRLLGALDQVPGEYWIRLLYLYPDAVTDDFLCAMAGASHVVPYLDIPIQHASGAMLKRMRRGHGPSTLRRVVERIKDILPEAVLRTTVLVGHPGETDRDFERLMAFIEWARFDHLGAFRYSDEEGTASFGATDAVSARLSYNRYRKIMAKGRQISRKKNRALKGATLEVLVEGDADEMGYVLSGRHAGQAPEIDGVTYLVSSTARPGDLVRARVVKTGDFDLVAEVIPGTL
jgi:ribosomal protein S12 methylthiotransferase